MSAVLEARSLYRFFHVGDDETLALQGVSLASSGRGRRRHRAVRLGQVDAAGVPGRARRAGRRHGRVAGERLSRRSEEERARAARAAHRGALPAGQPRRPPVGQPTTSRSRSGSAARRPGAAWRERGPRRVRHRPPRRTPGRPSSPAASSRGPASPWRSPTSPRSILADEPTGELDEDTADARDGPAARARRRAARRCWSSPTAPRSPPLPTARSGCATGGSRHDRRAARALRRAPRAPSARARPRPSRSSPPTARSAPATRIALVGPSGSGKSTLLHLMAGLDEPTVGIVDWPAIGERAALRPGPVAVIFQGPSLLPPLTVVENVALPLILDGHARGATRATAPRLALERLGLLDAGATSCPRRSPAARPSASRSARALAGRAARSMLADEPTGQLDRASGAEVVDALLRPRPSTPAPRWSSPPTTRPSPSACRERWEMHSGRLVTADEGAGMVALTWLRGLRRPPARRLLATAAGRRGRRGAARLRRHVPVVDDVEDDRARRSARVPVDWQVEARAGANPARRARDRCAASPGVTRALPVSFADTTGLAAPRPAARRRPPDPARCSASPPATRTAFPGELRMLAGAGRRAARPADGGQPPRAGRATRSTIGRAGGAPARCASPASSTCRRPTRCSSRSARRSGAQPQAPPDNVDPAPAARCSTRVDARRPGHDQVHAALSHAPARQPERRLHEGLRQRPQPRDAPGRRRARRRQPRHRARQGARRRALRAAAVPVPRRAGRDPRRARDRLDRAAGAGPPPPRRWRCCAPAAPPPAGSCGIALAETALGRRRRRRGRPRPPRSRSAASLRHRELRRRARSPPCCGPAAPRSRACAIAAAAIALPAWRDARALTVAGQRRQVGRADRAPWWARYGLDFAALAGAALVYWQASRNGYQLVLAPEGVPQVSVNWYALLAPVLAWIGAGCSIYRLADLVARRGRAPLARLLRRSPASCRRPSPPR